MLYMNTYNLYFYLSHHHLLLPLPPSLPPPSFYHGPIFWNYGLLPQTWEDPNHEHPEVCPPLPPSLLLSFPPSLLPFSAVSTSMCMWFSSFQRARAVDAGPLLLVPSSPSLPPSLSPSLLLFYSSK